MTGRFTFTLTEKELTIILDALDACSVAPPPDSGWGSDVFGELAAVLEARLQW